MSLRIACFAMSTAQKFHDLQQVAAELVAAGAEVRFWTDAVFRAEVEAIGASFADLFDPVPLAAVDDASRPVPSRYVSFAAACTAALTEAARQWGTRLVVYDSFTLIGEAVGRQLGVPWIPVFSGHLMDGAAMRSKVAGEPRVMTDPRCAAAVATLRDDFGMAAVTPFSYFADPSPWLNITCEPPEWVNAPELARYQPLACFGKLPAAVLDGSLPRPEANKPPRIYAAFGTVIWWYWTAEAAAALATIAATARDIGAHLVIGLGGGALPAETRERLAALGAEVHDFADQAAELALADIFVTHHGSGSSHEAIAAGVPMLSVPFSGDQPQIAARCQELGLALPLIDRTGPLEALDPQRVRQAIDRVLARWDQMHAALLRAREWELAALAARPGIARRILELG